MKSQEEAQTMMIHITHAFTANTMLVRRPVLGVVLMLFSLFHVILCYSWKKFSISAEDRKDSSSSKLTSISRIYPTYWSALKCSFLFSYNWGFLWKQLIKIGFPAFLGCYFLSYSSYFLLFYPLVNCLTNGQKPCLNLQMKLDINYRFFSTAMSSSDIWR